MTSVSQALPGFASAHAQPKQHVAGGKEKDSGFGDMVHGSEKPAKPQGKHSVAPVPPDAPQARRISAHPDKAELDHDAQEQPVSQNPAAGKTAKGGTDRVKVAAGADADTTTDEAPLQDPLPLLMALSDARHFAASPTRGNGGTAAEGQEEIHGLKGAAPSDPRFTSAKRPAMDGSATAEPLPRSGRATIAADDSGPDFGQRPAIIAAELPGRRDNSALPVTGYQTRADAPPSPQAWRPTAAKAAQAGQPVAQLGQAKSSAARMEVVSQQSFPAPAQNPMSQTAAALVDAIASDKGVQQAFSSASVASQTTNSVAVPTHVLKIELHPAELGAVTASLRLSGEQLSIEMKPQTHEAYRRLTADSDAIVKSLRGLGFDVDHVTVLQPSIAVHAASRADANGALPMSTGRDQPSSQPGSSGGNSAGSGRQPGRNEGNGAQEFGRGAALPFGERAGDDIYI